MTDPGRAGIVVAGGRSTRFDGKDKALAELDGVSLLRRVVDGLAEVVDEVVINCRREQVSTFRAVLGDEHSPCFAVDRTSDRGPVAGLETGLRAASTEYAFVTACDMPFVDPSFVAFLFDRARGHPSVVPVVGERRQPLCAVYDVEPAIAACETMRSGGSRRLEGLLERVEPVVLDEATVLDHTRRQTFANLNTGADLAVAEKR